MSKKQDRSSRKADLPDWADDVTPADEVMEKFYAPTGLFRPGPISVLRDSAAASLTDQIESGKETAEPQPPTESDIGPVDTPNISAEATSSRGVTYSSTDEVVPPTPPSPISPDELTERFEPAESETTLNRESQGPADTNASDSQPILFTEFANKWKRYLYPGQLAVMRALYELTFPHGTSECFTRYSELAAATKMSRRNCINVMNSLVERGFVERLEIRNDATSKGIKLRVYLNPL